MKARFYVFSGTGNTRKVCGELAQRLEEQGVSCEIFPIRERPEGEDYDVLVVGFPVHAFNAPAAVLKFLKSIPKRKERMRAYLMRTSGEPLSLNDASSVLPRRILKKRGYDVVGEYRFVMPYNIIFHHSEGMAARMWQAAQRQIPDAAKQIVSGGGERDKVGPAKRMASFLLRIEHTAMPIIGRRFSVADDCIGCGKCAASCPQGNIHMENGRPVFGKNCVGCMGCSFGCPKDALRISLLNGWRVNGAYSFDGSPAPDDEVCRYCRKSYLKYFHKNE